MILESHAGTCIQGYVYQVLPVHVRRDTGTQVLLDIIGRIKHVPDLAFGDYQFGKILFSRNYAN